jgi:hypothetical protein
VAQVRGLIAAAMVAGLAMTAMLVWRYEATYTDPGMRAYTAAFDHPRTHAQTLIDGMDGQAYGQIAVDPTMADAAAEFGTPADAAYREARPAYGWVAFIAAGGGGPARVAATLLVLSVLSVAALAAATGLLARRFGRPAAVGALVALLPGAAITVFSPGGAEAFGCALSITALVLWLDRRHAYAIALFSLAGLTRETLLLFPLALAGWELWSRRDRVAASRLAIPFAVYAAWIGVVYARVGAVPSSAGQGRLDWPLLGLSRAVGHWSSMSVKVAIAIVVLAAFAAVRLRHAALRWLLILHIAMATMLGELVWLSWKDFSRVLLPVAILGVVALWPATDRARRTTALPCEPERQSDLDGDVPGRDRAVAELVGRLDA